MQLPKPEGIYRDLDQISREVSVIITTKIKPRRIRIQRVDFPNLYKIAKNWIANIGRNNNRKTQELLSNTTRIKNLIEENTASLTWSLSTKIARTPSEKSFRREDLTAIRYSAFITPVSCKEHVSGQKQRGNMWKKLKVNVRVSKQNFWFPPGPGERAKGDKWGYKK